VATISLFYFSRPSYTQIQRVLKMHHPCFFIGFLGMSTSIFGQAMGALALFGLTVGLPVGCSACAQSAGIRTIGLPTPATSADVKDAMAAVTGYTNQQHDIRP
jgi:hypothetical protein